MRGRPMLEFCLFVLVWATLFVPLRAVTRSVGPVERVPASADAAASPIWVQLRFTEAPQRFVLYSGSVVVWEEGAGDTDQEQLLMLGWDEQSQAALRLEAFWDTAARRATEIRVSLPVGSDRKLFLWHDDESLTEALFFQ